MEQTQSGILEQLLVYGFILVLAFLLFFGIRKVVLGVKQHKKWAKKAAILLIILFVVLLIAGIIFYVYAMALGEAFSTGL